MARTVGIGNQNFENIIIHNDFYVENYVYPGMVGKQRRSDSDYPSPSFWEDAAD